MLCSVLRHMLLCCDAAILYRYTLRMWSYSLIFLWSLSLCFATLGTESCPPGVYYSSFIAQGGKKSLPMQAFKSALPMADLAFGEGVLQCTKPIWLFVGKNEGTNDLRGRNEHVDAVTHDGNSHAPSLSKIFFVFSYLCIII